MSEALSLARRHLSLQLVAWVAVGCLGAVVSSQAAHASTRDSATTPQRPRVGLALSGGGARGFAHVGVLRALEAMRIPIDCVAGTSAGSAIGAAYALGLSPDEIEAKLKAADWGRDIFNDQPGRAELPFRAKERTDSAPVGVTVGIGDGGLKASTGIFAGQKVELFLHGMLGYSAELDSFDQLPMPFRAIATDLATGEMVVQDRGSLVHAVRASMAVPSAFAPVRIGKRLLVDGGLTQNLPVQAVQETCADVVIAVNIGSPLMASSDLSNVFSIALQIINILMARNVADSIAALGPEDVLITPNLEGVSAVDFARGTDGIPGGESATLAARSVLEKWRVSEADYQHWLTQRRVRRLIPPDINRVEVAATRFVAPSFFSLRQAAADSPGPLDVKALDRRIRQWNGSGDFNSIAYSVRRRESDHTLWIEPQEKEWGPNYLQLGFAGAADSRSNADFSFSALMRRTWQNQTGAEWLTSIQFGRKRELETRWVQPLSVGSPWYIEPRLSLLTEPRRVFVGNRLLGEFKKQRKELELGGGLQGKAGEIHIGLVGANARTEPSSGFPGVSSSSSNISGLRLRVNYDTLDELDFPREGSAFRFESFGSLRGLGASGSYRRTDVEWMKVASWNDHTVRARMEFAQVDTRGQETLDLISTGGFLRLSGYQSGQFLSRGLAYGSLTYYRRLFGLPQPLGSGVFAGVSLETARLKAPLGLNVSALRRSGLALFLGASTALGPAYVGIGLGQSGQKTAYLFLGRP